MIKRQYEFNQDQTDELKEFAGRAIDMEIPVNLIPNAGSTFLTVAEAEFKDVEDLHKFTETLSFNPKSL